MNKQKTYWNIRKMIFQNDHFIANEIFPKNV